MTKYLGLFVWMSVAPFGYPFQEESTVSVGDEAPEFELEDASGRTYRLSDFRGKNAVVLEFFRSGDW